MKVFIGLGLMGLGFIIDSFKQTADFCQGGYLDKLLWQHVGDAVLKFTIGFGILAGLYYFLRILLKAS